MNTVRLDLSSRYQSLKEIGRGGAATVYVAFDTREQAPVAIKVLHRKYQGNQEIFKRFQREAEVMISMRHPHLVQLYDFAVTSTGLTYLVMEYVHGWSLKDLLGLDATVREALCLPVIHAIADVLSLAHGKGIVHRDLKPQNILISMKGTVKLSDFGIAKLTEGLDLTKTGHFVGTPLYSSPEQIAGDRDVDRRSDIYSLGCLMYEVFAGLPPFTQGVLAELLDAIAYGDHKHLRNACPNLSKKICKFQERMMAVDREKRVQSMPEVMKEIESLAKQDGDAMSSAIKNLLSQFGPPTTPDPPVASSSSVKIEQTSVTIQRPLPGARRPVIPATQTSMRRSNRDEGRDRVSQQRPRWTGFLPLAFAIGAVLVFFGRAPRPGSNDTTSPLSTSAQPETTGGAPIDLKTAELLKRSLQPLVNQPVAAPPWVPPVMRAPQNTLPDTGHESITAPLSVPTRNDLHVAVVPPQAEDRPVQHAAMREPQPFGTLSLKVDVPVSLHVNGSPIPKDGESGRGQVSRGPDSVKDNDPRAQFLRIPVFSSTAQISVSIPGMEGSIERTVRLERDQDVTMNLNLMRDFVGYVEVEAANGVRVFINGRFKGDSGNLKPIPLWKGSHDIQFLVPGYGPRWKKVDVIPGKTVRVSHVTP